MTRIMFLLAAVSLVIAPLGCKGAAKAAARAAREANRDSNSGSGGEVDREAENRRIREEMAAYTTYTLTTSDPTRGGGQTVKGPAGMGSFKYSVTTDAEGNVIGRKALTRPVWMGVDSRMNGIRSFGGGAGEFEVTWVEGGATP